MGRRGCKPRQRKRGCHSQEGQLIFLFYYNIYQLPVCGGKILQLLHVPLTADCRWLKAIKKPNSVLVLA